MPGSADPGRHGGHALLLAFTPAVSAPVADDAPPAALATRAVPTVIAAAPPSAPPLQIDPPPALPPAGPVKAAPPAVTPPSAPLIPVTPVTPAPFVNHAPSFVAGADQAVGEDAGAQTVAAWAHAISPGPVGEAGQTVTFTVTDGNAALFAAGGRPAVARDGTLSYTPAANASGVATVTILAADDGGTANGGADTSAAQTFRITVAPVNDAPSFGAGAAQTVNENSGADSVPGWATAIARGPADEAAQVVHFTVASSDTTLFTLGGQPAVAADGTLTFTPASGAHGAATLTVRAVDDGGTAGGGIDTSAPQTVVVTIVNRAPAAVADTPGVDEGDVAGVTFDVLANDTDPESDALTIVSYDDSAIADGAVTHGAGGSFTYIPAAHFAGSDTFSYTVSDGNGNTATAAVTITVAAVPDPPTAGDDAFVTQQGVALVQGAPGVLANDSDSGTLTVSTAPVVAPANGVVTLAADGSFTYTPALGFTGADTFTYRATNSVSGLSATAVVTVTVAATFSTSTLFLTGAGSSSELWDLSVSSQPTTLLSLGIVPDYDGNLLPGLTIKSSNGSDSGDAQRSQTWRYPLASGLVLDGPVVLHLTSSGNGNNVDYGYLYDCTAGGVTCTQIGAGSTTWNGGILGLGWVGNDVGLGTVNHVLAPGHELRVRVYSGSGDQAFSMAGDLPSSLTLTVP